MTRDSTDPSADDTAAPDHAQPELEHFDAAIAHVDDSVAAGRMAAGAAKGILYSIIETLGTLVGDPDLPAHARSGYEGLLETARELRARIEP
ncbi:major surface protein 3 [Caballeronia arationis]|jgi:hypothetical protein|uniref:Major surface protein 3 n=1 Tax=Caballeronia arationis TaxID=1777142 RepID=A0A7Z7N497_9BURK|nr:hypothetical protein [Caballeronia arationis]SAK76395.1 major surface protein 3 [Caballeronia arationis]SOE81610.1 hypothetical protein SAMN05446927_4899 [Caballeronia arationis]